MTVKNGLPAICGNEQLASLAASSEHEERRDPEESDDRDRDLVGD